jgi:hypothetical protein
MCKPTTNTSDKRREAAVDSKPLPCIRPRCSLEIATTTKISPLSENETELNDTFYFLLNDIGSSQSNQSESSKRSRRARRRCTRSSRPDAKGRINNKECHLFAFAELIEEQL